MLLPEPSCIVPSLGSLAAKVVQENPKALKSYKEDGKLVGHSIKVSRMTLFDIGRLKAALENLGLPPGTFIYTAGSDGRLEKSCRKESPVELIVLCDSETEGLVEAKINTLIKSGFIPIDTRVEYKDPETSCLLTCDSTSTICPSRFLHNLPLIGSDMQLDTLTLKFVKDLQDMPVKDRRKFKDNFVEKHTKDLFNTLDGKRPASEVDFKKGKVFYSGLGRKATKYSLLRPIQYTLDLVLVDEIRKKTKSPEEYANILKMMPRRVPDQIDYMCQLGFLSQLSPDEIINLKQAYTLGLFYMQTAQHLASSTGKSDLELLIPDRKELKKAYRETFFILNKLQKAKK